MRPEILVIGPFPSESQDAWQQLDQYGFKVERHADFGAGLARARVRRFDLLLVDARGRSFEQLEEIRASLRADRSYQNAFTPLVMNCDRIPPDIAKVQWKGRVDCLIDGELSATGIVMKIFVHCRSVPVKKVG